MLTELLLSRASFASYFPEVASVGRSSKSSAGAALPAQESDLSRQEPAATVQISEAARQKAKEAQSSQNIASGQPISKDAQDEVEELKKRDRDVHIHEQAHAAAAGSYAKGGPKYEYQNGPDGKRYAVGGSVDIDTSKEDTPEKTLQKARVISQAASAPAEPSGQDRSVAAAAAKMATEAQQEIAEEAKAKAVAGNSKDASTTPAVAKLTSAQAQNESGTISNAVRLPSAYSSGPRETTSRFSWVA